MSNVGVPHKCPTCCGEMIETEDGIVQNWYGRLCFSKDAKPYLCANCGTELVPSVNMAVQEARQNDLTDRLVS